MGPAVQVYDAVGANAAATDSDWTTCYFSIFGGDRSTNKQDVQNPLGDPAVLVRFSVGINAAPGSGSWTFTLMNQSSALPVSCTISNEKRSCWTNANIAVLGQDQLSVRMVAGTGSDAPARLFSAAAFQIKLLAQ